MTPPPWEQPGWFESASNWIHTAVEQVGSAVTGPIERPYRRPWSIILRVPTTTGDMYFKATLPLLRHETALTEALARWRPDYTLPVFAVDVERGWILLPDGGTRLREIVRRDHNLRPWEALLPIYGELQIELARRVPELLGLGVPDRRLANLPGAYQSVLDDERMLHVDRPDGITGAEYQRLRDLIPHVAMLCEQLAGYGVPESLNHGDFHDGNVFLGDGHFRLFDWGDATVTHPFFSLRSMFVSVEISLNLAEGSEPAQLRDAYLAAWQEYGTPTGLVAAYILAQKLSSISSALGWYRVISTLEPEVKANYAKPVPALLQEFLTRLDDQPA